MPDQPENHAAELRAAATLLRDDAHRAMTLPHIALMRPELGLALASWLDRAADYAEMVGADVCALAVARQILGTTAVAAPAAPTDRGAALREAADEIAGIDFHPNARARSLDIAAGLARRLRRMADEAQQPAPAGTCTCPHPVSEHSVYGCADGCACEWMPRKPAPAVTEEPTR
ncbi:hypothetical protein [Streptomyces sp. NPDC005167]